MRIGSRFSRTALPTALAAPVVVWGAWPFHRAAAINARHGAATMNTLISVGVLAAFGWSLYALFFGGAAGMDGRAPAESDLARARRMLEVVAIPRNGSVT